MKRFVTLAALALVLVLGVSSAEAQGYPPELYGDDIGDFLPSIGSMVWQYTAVWNVPYSIPDIVGFEQIVDVGINDVGGMTLTLPSGYSYLLTFVPDLGSYASWTFVDPTTISFVLFAPRLYYPVGPMVTTPGWYGEWYEGTLVFSGHPPQFWDWSETSYGLTAEVYWPANPMALD